MLAEDEVRVWRIPVLDPPPEAFFAALTDVERARAEAMPSLLARHPFATGRGALRRILARLLDCEPRALAIEIAAGGKPGLAGGALAFNVAHTADLVTIAVGAAPARIGIDVERRDRELEWEAIARRYLSPREQAALSKLEPGRRRHGFIACWTRKEALVKALGDGIATGLSRFDVEVDPEAPAALLGSRIPGVSPPGWSLLDVDAGPDHVASLAVDRADVRLVDAGLEPGDQSTSTTSPGSSGGRSP